MAQKEMASNCTTGGLDWMLGVSSWKGLLSTGTGFPERWWIHHPWGDLKDQVDVVFGMWFAGRFGNAELMVGLWSFPAYRIL